MSCFWLLIPLLLVVGCTAVPSPPDPICPDPVKVPAQIGKKESVGSLQIRVELARLAERRRGDLCAADADALRKYIAR